MWIVLAEKTRRHSFLFQFRIQIYSEKVSTGNFAEASKNIDFDYQQQTVKASTNFEPINEYCSPLKKFHLVTQSL